MHDGDWVEVGSKGVRLISVAGALEVTWPQIRQVVAFKRDRLAVDDLCLSILVGERRLEVDEDMPGWEELLGALDSKIMGVTPSSEWRPRVVYPPFARNEEVIFRRAEL